MSHLALWIHTPFAQALGWTLVHFIWEGAVLAALLMAALRVLRAEPAQRRYTLACLILAAMPVAFAVTLAVTWTRRPVAIAMPIHWVPVPTATSPIDVPAPRSSWSSMLDRLAWLVPVWFAGVAFFYARGLAGWAAVRRLRRRGVCAPPTEWQARLDELATRLRISRTVVLLESCFTDTPVLVGYLRPVILLPVGCLTGLSVAQVECILLHELAHVVRHDYVVNLLQSLVEGLLFYHPAVWWVSNVVRVERENCCDDRVVELMGDARAYAATLAVLEERRAPQAALAANGGNLMKRIRRLTIESRGSQTSVAPAASAAVLLVIFAAALTALPSKLPSVRHARTLAPARLAALAAAAATPQETAAQIATPYQKWLDEDVVYIIDEVERDSFVRLVSDTEREEFIERFWKKRDPSPDTNENEYREEHYRRIAYANEHFSGSVAGWRTDRGRTYIMYGPPNQLDDHSKDGGGDVAYPYQRWLYRYIDGVGINVVIGFSDPARTGDFQMTSDPLEKQKTPYWKWLFEDVVYIISTEERAAFQKLTTDQEREQFIENFWQKRGAAFREEHYRRIAYANEHFRTDVPGWKTGVGQIYIRYGPPDEIQTNDGTVGWRYRHVEGVGNDIQVVWIDSPQGNGEYRLARDGKQDQAAKVFASNERTAVSVIVPGRGQSATPGVIGVGDILEVGSLTTTGHTNLTNLDQALNAKRAECVVLENKYQANYPDVLRCNEQARALDQRRDQINAIAPQRLLNFKTQEPNISAAINASALQVRALETALGERTKELKEVQDRIARSPAIVQKFDMLHGELSLAKLKYMQVAAEKDSAGLLNQAKAKMEAKQEEIAAFVAENQGSLPENFQANTLEFQTTKAAIDELQRQISGEMQRQNLLEATLNNNKNLQAAQAQADMAPARRLNTHVTVAADGKIALEGGGSFLAAGMTPAQLEEIIGAGSTVRIAQSARQMVTVLVPLATSRDRFHVFGEVKTANNKIIQTFESDIAGEPALAKTVPLPAGAYHLVVVMKNLGSGATHQSALDFTVD